MSFRTSGLRIAGQDSDLNDIHFPSSDIPRCLLNVGLSPVPGKQMYGDSESIKAWIDAINQTNTSLLKLDDASDANIFEFVTHPFRTRASCSPLSDKFESESIALFCFDASAWAPEVLVSYHDDSDESRSESSLSDDAQYITIPSDSPWYRLPSPSPGPVTAYELGTTAYASSCSNDVRQAIAQQKVLLAVFYEELRRVVPHDDDSGYDPDWLGDVDVDLVLAPLETYADLCWESTVCDTSLEPRFKDRPTPDVPIGFDEVQGAY